MIILVVGWADGGRIKRDLQRVDIGLALPVLLLELFTYYFWRAHWQGVDVEEVGVVACLSLNISGFKKGHEVGHIMRGEV